MRTVLSFFGELKEEGKNHLILNSGSIVPELEGVTIETLPLDLKLTIKRTPCRVEIIQKDSHFEMRYELFKRLNTGGEGLTRQEIRNCIYRGFPSYRLFSDVVTECANNETFREIVNISTEAQEKMKYISANILEKGYNPEDLSNFVIKKIGKPIESITLDQLKKLIEQFKDQSLVETYKNLDENQEEEDKAKEETKIEIDDPLYSPMTYEIKTQVQQDNELLKLDKEKKRIKITVSEPKKEKSKSLFKKDIYTYKVSCPEIKTEVRRSYADFEWLKNQLGLYYALRVVPPLIKESMFFQLEIVNKKDPEEVIENAKVKYLNCFMTSLIKKKIFRTSAILYEFLELNESDFKKYKDLLGKYKYDLNVTLDNLKTVKGNIKFDLKKDDIKKGNAFGKKCNEICNIYQYLEKKILNLSSDFLNLETHMKQIGAAFEKLATALNFNEHAKKMEDIYIKLNKIFTSWSNSYAKQYTFFKSDFKDFFNYINLEVQEMNTLNQSFVAYKKEYEDMSFKLNKRKEDLYAQKDYSKWSVEPGTEDQIQKYANNKQLAFEKMLYQETELQNNEKKLVACTLYLMDKQFNKLMKCQSEDVSNYFAKMKQENQIIVGDAFNLIKLFSVEKEEK